MSKQAFKKIYSEARAASRTAPVVVARDHDYFGRPMFNVIKLNFHPCIFTQEIYQVIGAKHAPALPTLAERLADHKAGYPYDYT